MINTIDRAEVLNFLTHQISNMLQLKEKQIDPYLNLFEVGLDSLLIIKLTSVIRSEYGVKIEIKDLFEAVCLDKMATLIAYRFQSLQ